MQFFPWESWSKFLADNPWASEALEWLRYAKRLWNQYESIVIVVALYLIARKLGRERERLEERVDTLGQHVKAATEASDSAIAAAKEASDTVVASVSHALRGVAGGARTAPSQVLQPPPRSPLAEYADPERVNANRDRVNRIWGQLKERIDLRIQDIPRKNVRAKYSHMGRRSYRGVINALEEDGILSSKLADDLRELRSQVLGTPLQAEGSHSERRG